MGPGSRIGPYTVEAQIGQGGMASVYRIRDLDGQAWALKVLRMRKADVRERFRLEAAIHIALDHPNVVRGWEILDVAGDPAIRMDLVDGRPLDLWLLEHPNATLAEKDRLARQIVTGMGYAHSRGFLHRDLKPGNVLVEDRPDGPWARISDFGLAKRLDKDAATKTGIALGTPRYMAPEQVRDAKRVDARADVWSLGVLLYELYTGQPAFQRGTLIEVFTAVVEGAYVDPAEHGVTGKLRDAILGALQVDVDKRFPDCTALLAALEAALDRAEPPPPPVPPPPVPAPVEPPAVAPAAEPVAAEPVAAEVPAAPLAPEPPEARITGITLAPPDAPPPRSPPSPPARFPVRTWIAAWVAALVMVVIAVGGGLMLVGGAVTARALLDDDGAHGRP